MNARYPLNPISFPSKKKKRRQSVTSCDKCVFKESHGREIHFPPHSILGHGLPVRELLRLNLLRYDSSTLFIASYSNVALHNVLHRDLT